MIDAFMHVLFVYTPCQNIEEISEQQILVKMDEEDIIVFFVNNHIITSGIQRIQK